MKLSKCMAMFAATAALVFGFGALAQAKQTVIHAGRVIDGTGGQMRHNVSIVVDDERVTAVEDGFVSRDGAQLIDLRSATVLPGLIDCHDHISQTGDRRPTNRFFQDEGDAVINAVLSARREIELGFTTVRDLGSGPLAAPAVIRAIAAGRIIGPRIWSAMQPLGPTGGHSDLANGVRPDVTFAGRGEYAVDGVDGIIRAVREHHRRGARVIKIFPSGGVASIGDDPKLMLMSVPEMQAAVETAHALEMKVAAHAHGKLAIDAAVRAGVDSIEHGTYADAETYRLMKAHGTFLVPTLLVGDAIYQTAIKNPELLPPTVADKAKALVPGLARNLAAAYRAGVKIAFGTDQGATSNRAKGEEFALMVSAGVTPVDAILSATRNAAELIGTPGDIGSIQPGRYADIIAVDGDPLVDITEMQRVQFVMKGGEVFKNGGRMIR